MVKKGLETVLAEGPSNKGRLDVGVEDLPEIKGWKVGKTYEVCCTVKLVALRDGEYGDKGLRASFEVTEVEVDEDSKKGTETPRVESAEEKKAKEISNKMKAKRRI